MGKILSGVTSLFSGSSSKTKAAGAQAQLQQQISQVNQQNAANEGSRRSAEGFGQAARRRRGNLLLDTNQGKATIG